MLNRIRLCLILFYILMFAKLCYANESYLIGTYYFPGWTDNADGLVYPIPWMPIKKYPEKEPLLGYYSDSNWNVIRQQIDWMRNYGISFVVFDWYWSGKSPYLQQAVQTFQKVKKSGDIKYSILWANHYKFPGGEAEYRAMVKYWVDNYFKDPDFLTINGQPVIFIFGVENFYDTSKYIGYSPKELISIANEISNASGFKDIFFVGGSPALEHWVNNIALKAGFSAISAYNYSFGFSGSADSKNENNGGYQQLDLAYRTNWSWLLSKAKLPYIIPMTSGWDKRPWGGSKNSNRDNSISTADEFEKHLLAAKRLMDTFPDKTKKMGIICCWNEFGEGSYIEPTQVEKFKYLEIIKKTFDSD